MNKETKKVIAGAVAVWVLTVAGFGYNAYRQEIAIESNTVMIKNTMQGTVWKSQLLTQEEVQKLTEYRAANPAPEGKKYVTMFQGGLINGTTGFMSNLTPDEDIIIEIGRAGFANEAEAMAAGFLERKADGGTHIDWRKAKNQEGMSDRG